MADTDRRPLYTEEAVGANHPTKAQVVGRQTGYFHDNSGRHKWRGGSSVASATSISIPDDQNYFVITGTTTINGIASTTSGGSTIDTGVIIVVKFTGALTLTHNATSFIMPQAINMSISANDYAEFIHLGSGNWVLLSSTALMGKSGFGSYTNLKMFNDATNPNYQLDITADSIAVANTNGVAINLTSVSLGADITVSGANGLDTGTEAVSTWYYVYIIYNGATVASLLSLSATSPTMPSGYTHKRRIGAIYNDSGSNFYRVIQTDGKQEWYSTYVYLSGGAAGTFTLVSPRIPSTAFTIIHNVQVDAAAANFIFSLDGTNTNGQIASAAGGELWPCVYQGLNPSQQLYYKRFSGAGSVYLHQIGYIDNI